jgi:hypothetical protein
MITEGEYQDSIKLAAFDRLDGLIWQGVKSLCIDKKTGRATNRSPATLG